MRYVALMLAAAIVVDVNIPNCHVQPIDGLSEHLWYFLMGVMHSVLEVSVMALFRISGVSMG